MRTYYAARPGLYSLLGSLGGSGYQNEYNDTLRALSALETGRKAGLEATQIERRLAAQQDPSVWSKLGVDPSVGQAALQVATQVDPMDLVRVAAQQRAYGAAGGPTPDPDTMNRFISVGAGKTYEPYAIQGGYRLNQATGANNILETGQAQVAADMARAGASNAAASKDKYLSADGTIFRLPPSGSGGQAVPVTPPTSKYEGVSSTMAELFKTVAKDERGNPIIDPLTNRPMLVPDPEEWANFSRWRLANNVPDGDRAVTQYLAVGRPRITDVPPLPSMMPPVAPTAGYGPKGPVLAPTATEKELLDAALMRGAYAQPAAQAPGPMGASAAPTLQQPAPAKPLPEGVNLQALPDPAQHKGRVFRLQDGRRLQSNGQQWVPVR